MLCTSFLPALHLLNPSRRMFEAVRALEHAHPEQPEAAAYHSGLQPAVDALAQGVALVDEGYYLLEDMARSVSMIGNDE